MDVISFVLALVVIAAVGWVAWWIITKFMPEPVRTPALLVVGVILLIILLTQFMPGVAHYRLWK